jgi:Fibronectin type III domain
MPTRNDAKAAEPPAEGPEAAGGPDIGRILTTLDQVFSTFRTQLQDEAPKAFDGAAKVAVDTFNDIVAGLKFKSLPAALTIVAKPISATEIELTWTDDTLNVDGYRVRRCQGQYCTDFVEVRQLSPTARSFQDAGLFASTTYRYQLVAFNLRGETPSNSVTVTTKPAAART